MKKLLYIVLSFLGILAACEKLNVPPMNVLPDKDVFTSEAGVTAYFARMYSRLPIEDFKYSPTISFNAFVVGSFSGITGEALSRDMGNVVESFNYWGDAYALIREANYFMETLPGYANNFSAAQVNSWTGEARFIRAVTYFALVKRYGGVPLVDKVLTKSNQTVDELTATIDELKIPRSAEEKVYDLIAQDLDFAYTNLPESNQAGRVNKYAAAAFKSRAMLFAGTIAKYNTINLTTGSERLCGIPATKANTYFKASFDAAALLNGKYSLYTKSFAAGDRTAIYQNYVNLFLDVTSPENIFIRQYKYPDAVHGYDALSVPKQLEGPGGNYSSETNPTLNFVEMFEGLPRNADGTFQTLDANGKYLLYDNTMDAFVNAEPRLRATVVLPGDVFKGQSIEMRRGIYTGRATGGISRILPAGSTSAYPASTVVSSAAVLQTPYTLPNGTKMNPAGASGIFTNLAANGTGGSITGFSVRKYLVPDKPTSQVVTNRSEQSWLEIRYAEVLLNAAESGFELSAAGQGATYLSTALTNLNLIRTRAGATPAATLTSVDTIRRERRKELAFENKIYWDLRRWRILDQEQNGTLYKVLMPFYSSDAGKYFFDARTDERNVRFTFDTRWYYMQIPQSAITKSPNLVQNPGF
ncbi:MULTISPECIES: RagB/SusD family nutrient uptake outer membrane protein [Niastella]|uniref:RagB/SusD family nutrient uptake outer membrane protein n=1 Tax=Niastella soli TaxID=2821487 RepID=A0ABS3Z422_9BACT|nr:RagB/SusD family nutrient uptake outer membrane protein [Niastella soli]MBO9204914.1 RagB/SusD family nutrient uptake outer membrane protein [Niastella soli]